jgi:hypothetical protein
MAHQRQQPRPRCVVYVDWTCVPSSCQITENNIMHRLKNDPKKASELMRHSSVPHQFQYLASIIPCFLGAAVFGLVQEFLCTTEAGMSDALLNSAFNAATCGTLVQRVVVCQRFSTGLLTGLLAWWTNKWSNPTKAGIIREHMAKAEQRMGAMGWHSLCAVLREDTTSLQGCVWAAALSTGQSSSLLVCSLYLFVASYGSGSNWQLPASAHEACIDDAHCSFGKMLKAIAGAICSCNAPTLEECRSADWPVPKWAGFFGPTCNIKESHKDTKNNHQAAQEAVRSRSLVQQGLPGGRVAVIRGSDFSAGGAVLAQCEFGPTEPGTAHTRMPMIRALVTCRQKIGGLTAGSADAYATNITRFLFQADSGHGAAVEGTRLIAGFAWCVWLFSTNREEELWFSIECQEGGIGPVIGTSTAPCASDPAGLLELRLERASTDTAIGLALLQEATAAQLAAEVAADQAEAAAELAAEQER